MHPRLMLRNTSGMTVGGLKRCAHVQLARGGGCGVTPIRHLDFICLFLPLLPMARLRCVSPKRCCASDRGKAAS